MRAQLRHCCSSELLNRDHGRCARFSQVQSWPGGDASDVATSARSFESSFEAGITFSVLRVSESADYEFFFILRSEDLKGFSGSKIISTSAAPIREAADGQGTPRRLGGATVKSFEILSMMHHPQIETEFNSVERLNSSLL